MFETDVDSLNFCAPSFIMKEKKKASDNSFVLTSAYTKARHHTP
jgi:hypothetical protein